jgi:uncharacterized protein with HEPN domain
MTIERLQTYIDEMQEIGQEIRTFVAGMSFDDFAGNILAQRGIGMNLLMIGEASMQLAKEFPEFVADHPDIPWIKIRGMRNRIAHGYRSISMENPVGYGADIDSGPSRQAPLSAQLACTRRMN